MLLKWIFTIVAAVMVVYLPFTLFFQASFVAPCSYGAYATSAIGIAIIVGIALASISVAIRAISVASALRRHEFYAILAIPFVLTYLSIFMFALVYRDFGLKADGVVGPGDYLYFSVVTWTTLGYGDLVPIGPSRFFAALEALSGYFVSGLTISLLGSLFVSPHLKTLKDVHLASGSAMKADMRRVVGAAVHEAVERTGEAIPDPPRNTAP